MFDLLVRNWSEPTQLNLSSDNVHGRRSCLIFVTYKTVFTVLAALHIAIISHVVNREWPRVTDGIEWGLRKNSV